MWCQVNGLNTWSVSTLWSRTFFCLIDLFSSPISFLPFLFFRLHPHFLFLILRLILFLFPVLLLVSYSSSCPSFTSNLFFSSHFHSFFLIFISTYEPLLILRLLSPLSSFPPVLLSFFLLFTVPILFHHLHHARPSPLCGYFGCCKQNTNFWRSQILAVTTVRLKCLGMWHHVVWYTSTNFSGKKALLLSSRCLQSSTLKLSSSGSPETLVHTCHIHDVTSQNVLIFTLRSRDLRGFYFIKHPSSCDNIKLVQSTSHVHLTHWGRGHLNCLNARSRGLNNFNQLLYCVSLYIYNKFANYFCELKVSGNTHQRPKFLRGLEL